MKVIKRSDDVMKRNDEVMKREVMKVMKREAVIKENDKGK